MKIRTSRIWTSCGPSKLHAGRAKVMAIATSPSSCCCCPYRDLLISDRDMQVRDPAVRTMYGLCRQRHRLAPRYSNLVATPLQPVQLIQRTRGIFACHKVDKASQVTPTFPGGSDLILCPRCAMSMRRTKQAASEKCGIGRTPHDLNRSNRAVLGEEHPQVFLIDIRG